MGLTSHFLALLACCYLVSGAAVSPLLKHQIEEFARRDDDQLLDRRQSSTNTSGFTVVTGIQGLGVQPRLEIRELEKNADQWNIFLLGMDRFMRSNQSEKLSYYQVAGKLRCTARQTRATTDFIQASTGDPTSHGMASLQHLVLTSLATVFIFLNCSSHGTGLIWRFTRYGSISLPRGYVG